MKHLGAIAFAVLILIAIAPPSASAQEPPERPVGVVDDVVRLQVAPLQAMADGEHMKVYLDGRRVANVPNAVLPRTDTLFFAVSSATQDHPILIGAIRIAGGGADLYDRLERDGRVTTRGILFDVNSDAIRIESGPTLEEIGTMLQDHPDLRISIEGHTDSDGEEAFNQELSEKRAASVKRHLVESYGNRRLPARDRRLRRVRARRAERHARRQAAEPPRGAGEAVRGSRATMGLERPRSVVRRQPVQHPRQP